MDKATLLQTKTTLVTTTGMKILGAIALWIIGRCRDSDFQSCWPGSRGIFRHESRDPGSVQRSCVSSAGLSLCYS